VERLLFSIMSQVHQTSVIPTSLSPHLDLFHSVSHVMVSSNLGHCKAPTLVEISQNVTTPFTTTCDL
jgi:hypothetical protein